MTPDGFTARLATESDLPFVMALQRRNRESVGGLPEPAIAERVARRRAYGEALVGQMLTMHPTADEIRLRCAADIEANIFWRALGFVCVGTVPGGSRRGRLLNLWQRWTSGHLFTPDAIAVAPAAQRRVDCEDAETAFMGDVPDGFVDAGELPKLAWSNRRSAL